MQDNQSYLYQLCQQLNQKGLKPSVGLLKSKSQRAIPMKDIIRCIQHWKNDSDAILTTEISSDTEQASQELNLEQRVEQLEQQVSMLKQHIEKLSR